MQGCAEAAGSALISLSLGLRSMDQASERPVVLALHPSLLAAVPAHADLSPDDRVVVVVTVNGQLHHVGYAAIFKADPKDLFHFRPLGEGCVSLCNFKVADVALAGQHKVPFGDGSAAGAGGITDNSTWLEADGYGGFLKVRLANVRLLTAVQAAVSAEPNIIATASPPSKKQAASSIQGPQPVAMPKLPPKPSAPRHKQNIAQFFATKEGEGSGICAVCQPRCISFICNQLPSAARQPTSAASCSCCSCSHCCSHCCSCNHMATFRLC